MPIGPCMACRLQIALQSPIANADMLLAALPDFDQRTPHAAPARKPSRMVWQQRYDGIAMVAYQGGRAMACVSGPWSSKFVLTWWEPMPGGQLEIFDTQDDAMQAVERRVAVYACGRPAEVFVVTGKSTPAGREASWLSMLRRAFLPRRRAAVPSARVHQMRQRYLNEETDLSGLSFSASR